MYQIERTTFVEVRPTSFELANVFCDMDADEQAEFLNYIGQISDDWKNPLCMQMQSITDNKKLTQSGRFVMRAFGDYADKQTD